MIDTHTHFLDGDWLHAGATEMTVEEIVKAQDMYDISEMWMSSIGALADDFTFYNRNMFEKTKACADRLRYFAAASPYYGRRAVDEVRRCIEDYGFKGIKIHFWMQGGSVYSPATHDMMELAARHRLPVLFHDGTPPACDTLQIAWLAGQYPEVDVILGHSGLHDTFRAASEAARRLKNVYLCISASPIADVGWIIDNTPHGQLLFGSDYGAAPDTDLIANRRDAIEYACDDASIKEDIFKNNARALMSR